MISVQNLLRQLNGSKYLLFFLMGVIVLGSCSPSKKVINTTNRNDVSKSKNRDNNRKVPVDTVRWTEVPENEIPPIVSKDGPEIIKKSIYNIAVGLPFESASFTPEETSDRFVQFYAGLQMAMDVLESEGVNIDLTIIDTEGREKILKEKLENLKNLDIDLLIGPYERNCLSLAAEWALEHKTPMVSPWVASNRITKENPFYIQLRPSVRDHYDAIVQEVLKKYDPDQVIVLKRYDGKDDAKVKYIQDYAAALLGKEDGVPFREFGIEEDSLIHGETYMMDLISTEKPSVFISQNYLFEEDEYVYNTLRKLSAVKGENEVFVYGMPIILDIDKINFSLYKLLNVNVARFRYIDTQSEDIKQFRTDFFARYKSLPSEEAYFGYDVGYFFGNALNKFGTQFNQFLDQEDDIPLLGSRYDIQKTFVDDVVSDDYKDVNFLANKYVEIVRFVNNRFEIVKD